MKTVATMTGTAATAGSSRRLRVLVLDEALPWPPDSGKRLRTWNLLRHLAPRHDITFLAHGEGEDAREAPARQAMEAAGVQVRTAAALPEPRGGALYAALLRNCASPWPYSVAKHHTRAFGAAVQQELARSRYDLVQVEWTPYASHLLRLASPLPPALIASHNIEAQIWERRAQLAGPASAWYFRWQAAKMRRFEARAFAAAQCVTGVSELDAAVARQLGARCVGVVANGVDLEYFMPRPGAPPSQEIVFVGALDWFPNQDAVEFFSTEVMPLVLAVMPEARFRVVGRRPPASWPARLGPGTELVGEVADVRPELERAALAVAPLRIGGGSRIKILEALAMEKAVVATTVGAEGLNLQAGTHLQIADPAAGLAARVLELLRAPRVASEMGRCGAAWVRSRYGWNQSAQMLEQAWWEVTKRVPA